MENLHRYNDTHSGDKPHKCAHCEKAYARNVELKIHMRIHSEERPHKCDICDKAFLVIQELTLE